MRKLIIHVLISVGFLSLPFIFLAGEMITFHEAFHNPYDVFTLFTYVFLLITFFVHYYVLIPVWYLKQRYVMYLLTLICLLGFYFILYTKFDHRSFRHHRHRHHHANHHRHHHDQSPPKRAHLLPDGPVFASPPPIVVVTRFVFLFLMGIMAGLYLRLRERIQKAEMEKRLAELSYLKAQINPHFLFNTFNNLYALAVKESASKTANGMLKLSDMMRYIVTEASAEHVLLRREIEYINDFIALQRLRIDEDVKLTFSVNGIADKQQISPLILMPFIENAFKHGVNPDEKSEIEITIEIDDNSIHMHIKNRKVVVQQDQNGKLGFGIRNTKNRLDLVYPGRYKLEIVDNADWYTVHLNIQFV